jgi:hypothetical protein
MCDPVAELRRAAFKAVRDETFARKAISSIMSTYLGGLASITMDHSQGGGMVLAAWTDRKQKRGLIVRQDPHGTHTAFDIGRGAEIGRGDGLREVLEAVVQTFMTGRAVGE